MLKSLSRFYFWLTGWKVVGKPPEIKKYILVAAPHTSNWDLVYALCAWSILEMNVKYLAKEELFKFPLGILLRAFGGIPVNRSHKGHMVENMVELLKNEDEVALIVPVEGTRDFVNEWKTGFYYAALGANMPILLSFLDYKKKEGGMLPDIIYPSGDIETDLIKIKTLLKNITPKYPEKSSLKNFKPEEI